LRPSWVEVDLDAITHNVGLIAAEIGSATLCAVVKADGYGHGDVPVAEVALAAGADWLAVATVTEGLRLRDAGIAAPVLLLSEATPGDAAIITAQDLTPTVYSHGFLDAIAEAAPGVVAVHVKVDTGMHRVGTDEGTAAELIARIQSDDRLSLDGVWTHFPAAEDDADFTDIKQDLTAAIRSQLNPLFKVHSVIPIEELPRTASNKVKRRDLRDHYLEG